MRISSFQEDSKMSLRINSEAPNFIAQTTKGEIDFHQWIGDGWAILFSHPKDFTPVCTTELGYMAKLEPDFAKRNCKLIGLSVDPVDRHGAWAADIEETQGAKVNYPMDERNPAAGALAARSAKMDWGEADEIDDNELNQILWLALRGGTPPAPVRSLFGGR